MESDKGSESMGESKDRWVLNLLLRPIFGEVAAAHEHVYSWRQCEPVVCTVRV